MTDKGTALIDDLLDALESAKFEVTNVGSRYRVTNPAGGGVAFVPGRLPKGASFNKVMTGLAEIGFDIAAAQAAKEKDRQERLRAAREAGERALAEAARAAKARPAPAAFQAAAAVTPPAEFLHPGDAALLRQETVQPRTEVLDIDASFARDLLTANRFYDEKADHAGSCNRRFRLKHAQDYAEAMLRGEWTLAEAIKFDTDQELIDGQHRLMAVVLAAEGPLPSGQTPKPDIVVPFLVTYDMPKDAAQHLDTGLKRTIADQLQMRGEIQTLHLSAALRLITLYRSLPTTPYAEERWRRLNFTSEQATNLLEAEPEIRDAVRAVQGLRDLLPQSSAAAALHLVRSAGYSPTQVAEFAEALRTGANLSERSPVYVLRETYLHMRRLQGGRKAPRTVTGQHLAIWIMAFNHWARGKERTMRYVWQANVEPFPEILTPRPGR